MSRSAEVEQRALALVEQLLDFPLDDAAEAALLSGEPEAVRRRVTALKAAMAESEAILPTQFPDGSALRDMADPPEQIGAFRLVRRIGAGGMGGVWLAARNDGLYDQAVAIKFIRPGLVNLAGAAFRTERQILARLEHPNIARLIDGGVAPDGTPYLVMEYVDGKPIDDAVQGLTLAQRVRTVVKAADAVQFAHSRLVVHADLKPSNIFVDGQGRVKLLDFGIARLVEGESETSGMPLPMTAAYASPQRHAGLAPTTADDLYALGRILGEIAIDRDEDLAAIAAKAQAPDEADRYGSVAAMIADLDRWRDRLPVAARPATLRYRTGKFVERHRLGVLATAAALALLAISAAIATRNYMRAEALRVVSERRFNEVRSLSHFQLFDLYDSLARKPGTVAEREKIARTAAIYLDRLHVEANAPADLRLAVAQSYRRLAAIQGLSGTSSLGHPDDATRSLNRAEALLRSLIADAGNDASALAELGWVQSDRWTLLADNPDSARLNEKARLSFEAALRAGPDADTAASARLGRIATLKNAGYDLLWAADDPRAARLRFAEALAELDRTHWPAPLADAAWRLRVTLLSRLADALYYADDIEGALAPLKSAEQLVDQAAARNGGYTPELAILKGDIAFNISGVLGDLPGRHPEALAVAQAGRALMQRELAMGADAAIEKKILVLYGQEALMLEALGRTGEAINTSERSIALRERRAAEAPDDPQRRRDLAIGRNAFAELLERAGRRDQACLTGRKALRDWQAIRAGGRLSARDARKNMPMAEDIVKNNCPPAA